MTIDLSEYKNLILAKTFFLNIFIIINMACFNDLVWNSIVDIPLDEEFQYKYAVLFILWTFVPKKYQTSIEEGHVNFEYMVYQPLILKKT